MSEPPVSTMPRRLRDERGFMLIEVLVSAVILVTASLAIFATLSSTDTAAGNQQVRVEAANFAQSELERIRSLPVEDVMSYASAGTHSVTRNGIAFKETVVAKWVSDGGDEPQCTGQDGGLDFMRTTVTITWSNMSGIPPVTITSLFTPNAGSGGNNGSLSVHVINASGGPVQGVQVAVKGEGPGGSYSGTTNVNGCVVFGFIPQDTYDLVGTKTGYVDQDSNTQIKDSPQVTATQTTKVEYSYDAGGTTAAKFQTTFVNGLLGVIAGLGVSNTVPDYPQHFQIWHPQQTYPGGFDVDLPTNYAPDTMPTPSYPILPGVTGANPAAYAVASWDGRVPGTLLFPFTSPYTIYSGTCPANATQGSAATSVNITGGTYINAGAVSVPALQVKVWSGTSALSQGSAIGGAKVMVNTGCGASWTEYTANTATTLADVSSNGGTAPIWKGESNWGVGTLGDPGFPYTTLARVCVVYKDPSTGVMKYSATQTTANTNTTSGTLLNFYVGTGSSTTSPIGKAGSCQA